MSGTNYEERLAAEEAKLNTEEQTEINKSNQFYDNMINQSDSYYQTQIDEVNAWEKTQSQLQQENTDFAIEKIEQQKEQTRKDYLKEQKGAYADWKKQSNPYGVEAEQMAESGMVGTGYGESSQVRMWNAYQNRVAVARESYDKATLDYSNAMTEARLQNSAALAEIAHNSLASRLELITQNYLNNNELLIQKMTAQQNIQSAYDSKWQQVRELTLEEDKWNTEKSLYDFGAMQQIQTNYYSGPIAENVGGFGYMGKDVNGTAYQPKGVYINGHAYELNESGKTAGDFAGKNVTNSSGVNIAKQKVWEADGQYFVWNGSKNQYERFVVTNYYSGSIAENVGGYGYMGKDKNGVAYQPKGVYYNGVAYELEPSGKTAGEMFGKKAENSSGVNIAKQKVWVAAGQYYVWNGTKNQYERVGTVG